MFVKCTGEHETLKQCAINVNPLTAKLFNLNVHPLKFDKMEVNSLSKYCWLMSHFILNIFKIWYLMC